MQLSHIFSAFTACVALFTMNSASQAAVTVAELPGTAFKEGFIEVDGIRLRYMQAGPQNAPVLVSLPGSAGLEMSRAKDILAQDFRIIEIQPPGWGNSAELTREMEQRELGKLLGDAANKLVQGKYHLLGTSMGGGNALWLVYHYPERVRSLTLEGSMAPVRQADLTAPLIQRANIRKMMEAGGPPGGYPSPPPDPAKPWATKEYVAAQMQSRFRMMKWVQTDIGSEALLAKVRAAKVPVLALQGDRDPLIKLSVKDYYQQVLPQATFVVLPGGQHDLQNSRTDDFVREAKAFMQRN